MLLERSLIKSVILLAYVLFCLTKYTSRGCAYFVVLGLMVFKYTSFPPTASRSTCSSLYVDQEPQSTVLVNLSTNVDSKLTEKGLQVFFRLLPTHTCIYEGIYKAFAFTRLRYLHCVWLLQWHLQWHIEHVCTGLQKTTLISTFRGT